VALRQVVAGVNCLQAVTADKGKEKLIICRRGFHNGVFLNICSSTNAVTVVKSRRMRLVCHVEQMRKTRDILYGESQGVFGDLEISGRI
jgi:hypothetical protein